MKIRQGFVSNSSSSSFLIYGVCVGGNCDLRNRCDKLKLTCKQPIYTDDMYIGRSWSEVKDDETGEQFKKRVEKELTEFFGKETKCETLEAAWRDD
jgi:hypothetical protein